MRQLIPNEEIIISCIYTIRNQKVMFDFDLAECMVLKREF